MKKMMSLLLAALLLVACPAFADEAALQDSMPPELVEQSGAYGVIYDADGNVVGTVPAGDLVITDISGRDEVMDEAIAGRLANAYAQMMFEEHHTDVGSAEHDGSLKEDVNAALAGTEYTAYDLVMFEKFDVALIGDSADLLQEGYTLEVYFRLQSWQPTPIMVFHSAEGSEWHIVDRFVASGEDTVAVRMRKPGVVTFVMTQDVAIVSSDSYTETVIVPGEDQEEEYPIDMANFTPSVSGKAAPQVVSITYFGEDEEIEVEVTSSRIQVVPLREGSRLIVTPLSESRYTADIQTHEHLEWAYEEIATAVTLADLMAGGDADDIAVQIDVALKGTGLTHEDMIVRDLFEATIYGDYLEAFYNDETHIHVTFAADMEPGTPFVVLVSDDSLTWHALPAENAIVNADGTVTVCLHNLGVIAFLVDAATYVPAEGAVMSPETEG